MKFWNQSRAFNANDLNEPTGLMSTYNVKAEQVKGETKAGTVVDDGKGETPDAVALKAQQAETKKRKIAMTKSRLQYTSFEQLDDLERLILEDETRFVDPRTGEDESAIQEAMRHKLFTEIVKSSPHHQRAHALCNRGNIYQLITLVMREVTVTSSTTLKYMELFTALKLSTNESIMVFTNKREEIRKGAMRTRRHVITEDLLKGKIVQQITNHPLFKDLAVAYKQKECRFTYNEMC